MEKDENSENLKEIEEVVKKKTIESFGGFDLNFPSVMIYFTDGTSLELGFSSNNPGPRLVDEEYCLEVAYRDSKRKTSNISGGIEYYPNRRNY